MQFFHALLKYEVINKIVSKSAIKAFGKHLWYLTPEMVSLAIFSDNVPVETRRSLADHLFAIKPKGDLAAPQNRFGMGFGKPKFPERIELSTTLSDLVGTDSWSTFYVLQLDPQFMVEKDENWTELSSYKASLNNLQAVNVVNDCDERGVKLCSDFLASAKAEGHYQNVLRVVEHDRKHLPNLKKKKKISDKNINQAKTQN